MALTKCSECGHNVSTTAAACPNCGAPTAAATPPPIPGVPPPLPVTKSKRKLLWTLLIGVGGFCVLLVMLLMIAGFRSGGSSSTSGAPRSRLEAALKNAFQQDLSQNKQELFDRVHFIGDAKSDVVDKVSIQWKDGRVTDNPSDVVAVTVDHTLHWQTLLTADGFTRFNDTYDFSSGSPRLTNTKIVSTNGLTKEGATQAVINYGAQELTKEVTDYFNSTPAPSASP